MLTLIMYLYFDNVSVHWQLVCTKYKSATVGGGGDEEQTVKIGFWFEENAFQIQEKKKKRILMRMS